MPARLETSRERFLGRAWAEKHAMETATVLGFPGTLRIFAPMSG